VRSGAVSDEDETLSAPTDGAASSTAPAGGDSPTSFEHVAILSSFGDAGVVLAAGLNALHDQFVKGRRPAAETDQPGGVTETEGAAPGASGPPSRTSQAATAGSARSALDVDSVDGQGDGGGAGPSQPPAPGGVRVSRSEGPINEYQVQLSSQMMAHFWNMFPLGNGLPPNYLSDLRTTRRLLLHYSGTFARNTHFILLVVNQVMRHKVNTSVGIRAKKCEGEFAAITEIVNDPEFLDKLRAGMLDPKGEAAQDVYRRVLPYCSLSGKHVPWGKMERGQLVGDLLAMCRRFGTGSCFLSVAPDDVWNPTSIRLCFPTSRNDAFPAEVGEFVDALHSGSLNEFFTQWAAGHPNQQVLTVPLPTNVRAELQRLAGDNGVATTVLFMELVEFLFEHLVGMPSERSSTVSRKVDREDREKGLFGTPVSWFAVYECNNRLALHVHALIFTAACSRLLARAAGVERLESELAEALDTQYSARVPWGWHALNAAQRSVFHPTWRANQRDPPGYADPGETGGVNPEYVCRVCMTAVQHNGHDHGKTCRKCGAGAVRCRMCKPSGHNVERTCVCRLDRELCDAAVERARECSEDAVEEVSSALPSGEANVTDGPQPSHLPCSKSGCMSCKLPFFPLRPRPRSRNGASGQTARVDSDVPMGDAADAGSSAATTAEGASMCGRVEQETFDPCSTPLHPPDRRLLSWELFRPSSAPPRQSDVSTDASATPLVQEETKPHHFPPNISDAILACAAALADAKAAALANEQADGKQTSKAQVPVVLAKRLVRLVLDDADFTDVLRRSGIAETLQPKLDAISDANAVRFAERMVEKHPCENAWLVEFNDILTASLGCNSAPYMLGATEGAKAAMFYMVKYVTKDSVELKTVLSIMADAMQHVEKYPSVAEDHEDPERKTKHFVQRFLNMSQIELSLTQACGCLLNRPAHLSSHKFQYVAYRAALQYAKTLVSARSGGGGHVEDEDVDEDDADVDGDDVGRDGDGNSDDDLDAEEMADIGGGHWRRVAEEEGAAQKRGCATFHRAADGDTYPISLEHAYAFRGAALAKFNYEDYCLAVSFEAVTEDDTGDEDGGGGEDGEDGEGGEGDGGKRRGLELVRFPFHGDHPLHGKFTQRLRRKFACPKPAGKAPPAPPRPYKGSGTPGLQWQVAMDEYCAYMLAVYKPWHYDGTGPVGDLSHAAMCAFVSELQETSLREPDEPAAHGVDQYAGHDADVAHARLFVMENVSYGLQVNVKDKNHLSAWRGRNCTQWPDDGMEDVAEDLPAAVYANAKKASDLMAAIREKQRKKADSVTALQNAVLADDWMHKFGAILDSARGDVARGEDDSHGSRDGDDFSHDFPVGVGGNRSHNYASLRKRGLVVGTPATVKQVCAGLSKGGGDDGGDDDGGGGDEAEAVGAQGRAPLATDDTFFDGAALPPEVLPITDGEWASLHSNWVKEREAALRAGRKPSDAPLNPEQRTAIAAALPALVTMALGRAAREPRQVYAARVHERHGAPTILLHGPAGTGKSVVLHALDRIMRRYGLGTMLASAFTGVAAAPLPGKSPGTGAPTLCTLLGMEGSLEEGTVNTAGSNQKVASAERIKAFEHWAGPCDNLGAIFVDEVSFVSPGFMHHMDLQLQLLMKSRLPFGGLVVIVAGDFYQLPPVRAPTLWESMVQMAVKLVDKDPEEVAQLTRSAASKGVGVFKHFRRVDLFRPMRQADDEGWAVDLTNMRSLDHKPVPARMAPDAKGPNALRVLDADDVQDVQWRFATHAVKSNRERWLINERMAEDFARYHKVPLVRWRLKLTGQEASHLSRDSTDSLYRHERGLWGTFVPGGPCIIEANINPSRRLANGSMATMHSLTLAEGDSTSRDRIERAEGFAVVELEQPPLSVNVVPCISEADGDVAFAGVPAEVDSVGNMFLRDGDRLVPILRASDDVKTHSFFSATQGFDTLAVSKHQVELAFAVRPRSPETASLASAPDTPHTAYALARAARRPMQLTDYKLQGKTLERLVISNGARTFRPPWSLSSLYVMLTRVKTREGVRLLSRDFEHLLALERPFTRGVFEGGYVYGASKVGVWDDSKALEERELLLERVRSEQKRKGRKGKPSTASKTAAAPKSGAQKGKGQKAAAAVAGKRKADGSTSADGGVGSPTVSKMPTSSMRTRSADRRASDAASKTQKTSTWRVASVGAGARTTRSASRASRLATPQPCDSDRSQPSKGSSHPSPSSRKRPLATLSSSPITRRLSQINILTTHAYSDHSCHISSCLVAIEFALRKAVLNKVHQRSFLHRSCFATGDLGNRVQAWLAIREAVVSGEYSRCGLATAVQAGQQLSNARDAARRALEEAAQRFNFPKRMEEYRDSWQYRRAHDHLRGRGIVGTDQQGPTDEAIRGALVEIQMGSSGAVDRNLRYMLLDSSSCLHIGTRCAQCKKGFPLASRLCDATKPLTTITEYHFNRCGSADPFKAFAADYSEGSPQVSCNVCGCDQSVELDVGLEICRAVSDRGLSALPPIIVLDTDFSSGLGHDMHFDASESHSLCLPIGTERGSRESTTAQYQLAAAIYYKAGGHFVTKCTVDGEWFLFDDIKRRRNDDTVQGHRTSPPDGSAIWWANHLFAGTYKILVLFYVRRSDAQGAPPPASERQFSCTRFTLRDLANGQPTVPTAVPDHDPPDGRGESILSHVVEVGGLQNVGCSCYSTQSVGVLVAANSGRPGGSCGWGSGCGGVSSRQLHARHTTMEEDIVANWLLTHAFNSAGGVAAPSAEELDRCANGAFRCIHNAWGLRRESRTGNVTRQGVDYTRDGVEGVDYADVWVVPGVRLSRKESCECSGQRWFDHSDQFEASLYFAAAPNAGPIGTSAGSMARTFNRRASEDEEHFMDGVRWALRASLCAMAKDGVHVVLLPLLGGGVYGGRWGGSGYRQRFIYLVKQVLEEKIAGRSACLQDYFNHVVIVTVR
jgi:hypothetical protein